MFLFEEVEGGSPINVAYAIDTIATISFRNIKFMPSKDQKEEYKDDAYEVTLILKDGNIHKYQIVDQVDIDYFFRQLRKVGLE